jgi:hypothetical protein
LRSSLLYRLGLLLVAIVMVILPLVYLAIIALVVYGVYYHAINHTGVFTAVRGVRTVMMAFLVYVAPMIVGGIVVFFMFKPLFARPARRGQPLSLGPDAEPFLFAFVDRVCEAVGAPRPKQIDIDCDVNASASFRKGLLSFLGNDLVLTIGMPLAGGLTLQQFAGVLAHEFGHFSQAAGMRLTYLIRSISAWFTRVVYERDEWDETLVRWSHESDLRIGWIFYLARFFVWLTSKVLWVLMMIGHAVGGFLLREMELDADRHEARLAGSKAFEATVRQLMILTISSHRAQDDLGQFHREGRLPDDLPRLILANAEQLPQEVQAFVSKTIRESSTGWFDTHPCDKERIANARRENARGIFRVVQPAAILFRDFAKSSKKATRQYYRHLFGEGLKRQVVQPTEQLLKRQGEEVESFKALGRYFQAGFQAWRNLPLSAWQLAAPSDPKQTAQQLNRCRREMLKALPEYKDACQRYGKVSKSEKSQLEDCMAPFERTAAQRLFAALQLLHVPSLEKKLAQAPAWRQEIANLLPALKTLNEQVEATAKAARMLEALEQLLNQVIADRKNLDLFDRLSKQMREAEDRISQIRLALSAADYPFEHAKLRLSIGAFVLPDLPESDNPVAIYHALGNLVNAVYRLRARVVGRLCVIAEQVESALGLKPLAEPSGEEENNG